ncbi:MAG: hypothetical protein ACK4V6_12235 [Microthrixaceae bacterium]
MNTIGSGGEIPADADRFVAEARVDDAVRDRRRRGSREQRQLESLDVIAVLLGAIGRQVRLHLDGGGSIDATVRGVGADVVDVSTPTHRWWIRLGAVLAVEVGDALPGDRADLDAVTMVELLTDLVDTAIVVQVTLRSGSTLHGEVSAIGDALVMATDGPSRTILIALDAVTAVRRSG